MPEYRGTVRDLDFVVEVDAWQAILDGDPGELVVVAEQEAARSLLEISFAMQVPAEVTYTEGSPNVATRVKLNREFAGGAARAYAAAEDDDPAAPAAESEVVVVGLETGRDLANFGVEPVAAEPSAADVRAAAAVPTIPLDISAAAAFEQQCRQAGVGYGLGAKVPRHGAVPGQDFRRVDCSGFVREAIWRGTSPHQDFPDGSVNQHDWIRARGFARGTSADALASDGVVRIAFLRPQDTSSRIGHVVLIHNARTLESHGGVGPDARPWTNSGWQAKTFVYVLRP